MAQAILKTLPTRFARGDIERFFGIGCAPCFQTYFFTLGRGRPRRWRVCLFHAGSVIETETNRKDDFSEWQVCRECALRCIPGSYQPAIDSLYFTHKGIVIGHFAVWKIVQNAGQLPKLTNMDGDPSAWQIPGDAWVAVCNPPWQPLEERIYHHGFQGWRYFDLETHRGTLEAKIRL